MIGSLRGTLLDRQHDGEVLIEVAGTGLGYRVMMSPAVAHALGDIGTTVSLWTHHHLREDAQVLYGFSTIEGRSSFEALISAHGVGPSLALAILSVHEPATLARIIAEENDAALCLVPGVGKKTAARLLIELKSRFDAVTISNAGLGVPATGAAERFSDLSAALENLGYRGDEIAEALAHESVRDANDTSSALRAALAHLGGRR